ncbi:MAG: anti-CRISPR protein AcrIIA3 [Ligilactobacillus animalis]|uniref:anti-CRISPR protein AcrIIA3 n=1 Tax=Ligilactobacillus animalis TaxID=1605 RepID=UPI00242C3EB4|nr:anti-CRISPR protein AcrIIA3 [Ligilactobacillus animalis]MCI5942324.1 anti-CRISPR protein AcrIIA3 [Ligilactobacillus animalis]MDY2993859.1 anti-CRISPR protein AcrIIA3 [Ligilactobacillus animalis]
MIKCNKSDVMKLAWALFEGTSKVGDFEHIEWSSIEELQNTEKTFALCLKEAWGREKEVVEMMRRDEESAPKTEQVKAWNWAEYKLGVKFNDLTPVQKMREVDAVVQEWGFGKSVWFCAIKAVERLIEMADHEPQYWTYKKIA